MEGNKSIEDILFNDFEDQANEDYLKTNIQYLIQDKIIHDCTFFINWTQSYYRDNLKGYLQNVLNHQKQKNEKKLLLARVFYEYCDISDILEHFNQIIDIDHKFYY